ncbi:MAG: hypothetical protein LBQ59_03950 [Candidatus Peribacteria bacterium]|jgi:hypothetical protein|nr:hypothetical protein [Candidatus Peribacteria bacterium]
MKNNEYKPKFEELDNIPNEWLEYPISNETKGFCSKIKDSILSIFNKASDFASNQKLKVQKAVQTAAQVAFVA